MNALSVSLIFERAKIRLCKSWKTKKSSW